MSCHSLALLALVAAFATTAAMARAQAPAHAPELSALVEANNGFALGLYAHLRQREGNLFFSPYSIHSALAMTSAGARGQTAAQILAALQVKDHGSLHTASAAFMRQLNEQAASGATEFYRLAVANALWSQGGFDINADFARLLDTHYGASLREVDFIRESEAARRQINDWVAQKTNDKIQDLIPPGMLTSLTRMVLTNAIYFRSNWAQRFPKDATRDDTFHLGGGRTATVPMMHQQKRFGYMQTDRFQAVELPYTGNRLSMLVLLPREVDGLAALERELSAPMLADIIKQLRGREVAVALPRFQFSAQFAMKPTLREMGIVDAFVPDAADFSGISTAQKLFVQDVVHKAFVAVDEEGTEAAAATGVVFGVTAAPMPQEPVVFRADRPFLFVIRHNTTGQILFLGRVSDPR